MLEKARAMSCSCEDGCGAKEQSENIADWILDDVGLLLKTDGHGELVRFRRGFAHRAWENSIYSK